LSTTPRKKVDKITVFTHWAVIRLG